MKRFQLLDVCARIGGHHWQHELIRHCCAAVSDWNELLSRAETEGMAPLMQKHLQESGANCPPSVQRSLVLLAHRHRKQAGIRIQVLAEVLDLLEAHRLDVLVLKGAALCQTLYPDPSLRPMRDIDLLFRPEESDAAHQLLKLNGFQQAEAVIPADHFHLPPLYRDEDQTKICIEIHRGLYPNCPPYYPAVDFNRFHEQSRSFSVGSSSARTLNNEEMLHYLYQHGFHAPLTYEPYKLINAADLIGFVEQNYDKLDWDRLRNQAPQLVKAIPLLHHLAPWNPEIVDPGWIPQRRLEPRPYDGWPHKRLRDFKAQGRGLPDILRRTFLPPTWWLGIYYGAVTGLQRFFCLIWRHPRHVFWWARLYRSLSD